MTRAMPAVLRRRTYDFVAYLTVAVTAIAARVAPTHAQAPDGSCRVELFGADFVGAAADVARVLDLLGEESRHSFAVRRGADRPIVDTCNVPASLSVLGRALAITPPPDRGAVVLPAHARIISNSGYPRDWNDGAQWGGRGLSGALNAGAMLRWNRLEAAVAPIFAAQANEYFAHQPYPDAAYSRYIDRWHGRFIDLPQRFGPRAYTDLEPGQSYARVHVAGWRAGISSENLAWGPARRNPLLLSGTAAGFPHVFIETSRPNNVVLGTAELQLFWGRLSESDYFDHDPDNDHRALSGVVATLRPHGLDGLYLGAARLHAQTWHASFSAEDLFIRPFTGVDADSVGLPRDLLLYSLFMRWVSAPGGFEVYGEWARQDAWKHWFRLLNPVNSSQAYSIGLQKVVRHRATALRFAAEFTHLADALPHRDLGRGITSFYVSPHVVQGHTHRGQLLGAPIGPGSEAQFIGADLFWKAGRTGLSVERVRYDDDAYYAIWSQWHGPHGHDTELSFRAGHLVATPRFAVEAELGYSFRYSRDFLGLSHVNYVDYPYRKDTNISLRLSGRWNPPSWSWPR